MIWSVSPALGNQGALLASWGLQVPCTTKFTACRSACARSCWSRAWILGSGLLLPVMEVT